MVQRCKGVYHESNGRVPVDILVIGVIDNNCFVVSDGQGKGAPCMVIDPTGAADAIMKVVGQRDLRYIVCTHHHSDHVSGVAELKRRTGAKVVASTIDAPVIERGMPDFPDERKWIAGVPVDIKLDDGDSFKLGTLEFQVLLTPGHTPGGICLYLPGQGEYPGQLFTGDTLFQYATGRVDFEGGSEKQMRTSLRTKLAPLPDFTVVYPGHNSLTSVGAERHRVIEAY